MFFELKPDETGNLYPVREEMPCLTSQISIWRWAIPNTLDRIEREEAAARLIAFSIHCGEWVGVSFARIGEMCMADIELHQKAVAIREANRAEAERVAKANRRRSWLNLFTLGWYGHTHPEEVASVMDTPNVPMTGIYVFGHQYIITGFRELREDGMVLIENVDGEDFIYPTPKLLQRIMKVQGVAA